jgi:hypothetical protein
MSYCSFENFVSTHSLNRIHFLLNHMIGFHDQSHYYFTSSKFFTMKSEMLFYYQMLYLMLSLDVVVL